MNVSTTPIVARKSIAENNPFFIIMSLSLYILFITSKYTMFGIICQVI